ncbi:MAG: hypothetical protein ACEY3C_02220 [Candidatus Tisiphia sp.]
MEDYLVSDAYLPHLEGKRAYLDRTKMFIRLNYQSLSLVSSHHDLSDYSKVLWLDFFATGYRYYLKHRSIDKNVTTTNIINIDDDYTNNLQHLEEGADRLITRISLPYNSCSKLHKNMCTDYSIILCITKQCNAQCTYT